MAIVLKERTSAKETEVLRLLYNRMKLSKNDDKRFSNLSKGLEGEKRFDQLSEALQTGFYVLHDICLEHNHSVFQIDTLLISEKEVMLIEIKNYEGEFVYDSGVFRILATNQEILNPLHQLNRSVALLRSLFKKAKFSIPVTGYLAFVNEEFTLFQAPVDLPMILPSQLTRFLNRVNQTPSSLNRHHRQIADYLLSMHLSESPYAREPDYLYGELQKGILCADCNAHTSRKDLRIVTCNLCNREENMDAAIIRTVNELRILFPVMKITTPIVEEWCVIIDSRKTIRRVLAQNFEYEGDNRHRHYREKLVFESER